MLNNEIRVLANLVADVERITDAGGTVPADFHRIYEAYQAANRLLIDGDDSYDDLLDAVLAGNPSKVAKAARDYVTGRAMAKNYEVRNRIARDVRDKLRQLYATVAADNYETIRQQWQADADAFAELSSKVDTNAPAEAILHASAEARAGWEYAPVHARDLDIGASVLTAAARLAGAKVDELKFALTVGVNGLKRRAVWAAWDDKEHRCGRWGALLAAGAALRTVPLDQVESYRRPKPIETRYVPGDLPGSWRPVEFDPEEEEEGANGAKNTKTAKAVAARVTVT